jgi:hypothetical protein
LGKKAICDRFWRLGSGQKEIVAAVPEPIFGRNGGENERDVA